MTARMIKPRCRLRLRVNFFSHVTVNKLILFFHGSPSSGPKYTDNVKKKQENADLKLYRVTFTVPLKNYRPKLFPLSYDSYLACERFPKVTGEMTVFYMQMSPPRSPFWFDQEHRTMLCKLRESWLGKALCVFSIFSEL